MPVLISFLFLIVCVGVVVVDGQVVLITSGNPGDFRPCSICGRGNQVGFTFPWDVVNLADGSSKGCSELQWMGLDGALANCDVETGLMGEAGVAAKDTCNCESMEFAIIPTDACNVCLGENNVMLNPYFNIDLNDFFGDVGGIVAGLFLGEDNTPSCRQYGAMGEYGFLPDFVCDEVETQEFLFGLLSSSGEGGGEDGTPETAEDAPLGAAIQGAAAACGCAPEELSFLQVLIDFGIDVICFVAPDLPVCSA